MKGPYDDIIGLSHPTSTKHTRMPISERAAQFSPFAALTGYDAAVKETARLTDSRGELDEDAKAALDLKLRALADRVELYLKASITYFSADKKKAGGAYVTAVGPIKTVDDFKRVVVLTDGTQIPIEDIFEIELE